MWFDLYTGSSRSWQRRIDNVALRAGVVRVLAEPVDGLLHEP